MRQLVLWEMGVPFNQQTMNGLIERINRLINENNLELQHCLQCQKQRADQQTWK